MARSDLFELEDRLDRIERKLDWLHWEATRGTSESVRGSLDSQRPWPGDLK